jgi:hypothetical protein
VEVGVNQAVDRMRPEGSQLVIAGPDTCDVNIHLFQLASHFFYVRSMLRFMLMFNVVILRLASYDSQGYGGGI